MQNLVVPIFPFGLVPDVHVEVLTLVNKGNSIDVILSVNLLLPLLGDVGDHHFTHYFLHNVNFGSEGDDTALLVHFVFPDRYNPS
jgi:hypothetical protein